MKDLEKQNELVTMENLKNLLRRTVLFINNTYDSKRDHEKAQKLIDEINVFCNDDSIQILKGLCKHSIFIESKNVDKYGYCDECRKTIQ